MFKTIKNPMNSTTFSENEILRPIALAALKLETLGNHYFLRPLGLSTQAVQIMKIVNHYKEVTPSGVCQCLGSSKSNITQRLKWLEQKGLIEKSSTNSDDKRQIYFKLSADGQAKMKTINRQLKESEMHLEKFFTKEEIKNHIKFFQKFLDLMSNCEVTIKK